METQTLYCLFRTKIEVVKLESHYSVILFWYIKKTIVSNTGTPTEAAKCQIDHY